MAAAAAASSSSSSSSAAAAAPASPLFTYARPPLESLDPATHVGAARLFALFDSLFPFTPTLRQFWISLVYRDRRVYIRAEPNPAIEVEINKYLVSTWQCKLQFELPVRAVPEPWVEITIDDVLPKMNKQQTTVGWRPETRTLTEYHPEWDLTVPSRPLERAEIQNPPPWSILRDAEAVEILSLMEQQYHMRMRVVHGPHSAARRRMWKRQPGISASAQQRNEANRLRLAAHLSKLPGVLMDMASDPMCPWKGMKFFHGTPYDKLQQLPLEPLKTELERQRGLLAEHLTGPNTAIATTRAKIAELEQQIATSASSAAPSRIPCKLSWDDYLGTDGEMHQGSAFLSPYFTKGYSYGGDTPHIYTYTLRVEGRTLRFLDLRNDYDATTHNHRELDPYAPIWELAGIPHGDKNRNDKARDLYELFKGTNLVDGAVMNSDVEWIFFDAPAMLDWVPPPPPDPAKFHFTEILLNVDTEEEDEPVDRDLQLLNVELMEFVEEWVTRDKVTQWLSSKQVHKREIQLSELPVVRWKMDHTIQSYIAQFLATAGAGVPSSPLWNAYQPPESWPFKLMVYECEYHALWQHFSPELDNIWMADAIIEGVHSGISRKHALPFYQLSELMRKHFPKTHLLVHLPNGFVQLVPSLREPTMDRRMYIPDPVAFASVGGMQEDMPVRNLFRVMRASAAAPTQAASSAAAASSKRKGRAVDDETEEQAQDETDRAPKGARMGTGGKWCIC